MMALGHGHIQNRNGSANFNPLFAHYLALDLSLLFWSRTIRSRNCNDYHIWINFDLDFSIHSLFSSWWSLPWMHLANIQIRLFQRLVRLPQTRCPICCNALLRMVCLRIYRNFCRLFRNFWPSRIHRNVQLPLGNVPSTLWNGSIHQHSLRTSHWFRQALPCLIVRSSRSNLDFNSRNRLNHPYLLFQQHCGQSLYLRSVGHLANDQHISSFHYNDIFWLGVRGSFRGHQGYWVSGPCHRGKFDYLLDDCASTDLFAFLLVFNEIEGHLACNTCRWVYIGELICLYYLVSRLGWYLWNLNSKDFKTKGANWVSKGHTRRSVAVN